MASKVDANFSNDKPKTFLVSTCCDRGCTACTRERNHGWHLAQHTMLHSCPGGQDPLRFHFVGILLAVVWKLMAWQCHLAMADGLGPCPHKEEPPLRQSHIYPRTPGSSAPVSLRQHWKAALQNAHPSKQWTLPESNSRQQPPNFPDPTRTHVWLRPRQKNSPKTPGEPFLGADVRSLDLTRPFDSSAGAQRRAAQETWLEPWLVHPNTETPR